VIQLVNIVNTLLGFGAQTIRLYLPLDDIINPKYKLLHFLTTKKCCKENKALAFNRDWCCHLALCLRLFLFHLMYFSGCTHATSPQADLFRGLDTLQYIVLLIQSSLAINWT
jgi:hypothetical protein